MKKTNLFLSVFFVALTLFVSSCSTKKDDPEPEEPGASEALAGTWTSTSVVYTAQGGLPDADVKGSLTLTSDKGKATGTVSVTGDIKDVNDKSLFEGISTFEVITAGNGTVISFKTSTVGTANAALTKIADKELIVLTISDLKDYKVNPVSNNPVGRVNTVSKAIVTFEKN